MDKYRLIILGAGFSVAAGLPLATTLWDQVRQRAAGYGSNHRASKFFDDLDDYIDFRNATEGIELDREAVDFEDFMRFLDVEHHLGLRGSDTWSDEGNEGTVVTKHLIGKIICNYMANIKEIPEIYKEFAKNLTASDTVITFNYDNLLEASLDAVGKAYKLFPYRYKSIGEHYSEVEEERGEVTILKMHGSIDWFDKSAFDYMSKVRSGAGLMAPPEDPVFSRAKELRLEKLVDGPRPENDPLSNIYRVRDISRLHDEDILFRATPRLLSPSAHKLVYARKLNDFWDGMGRAGPFNFGMSIIGFSMPLHDEYLRQIIFRITRGYQNYNWDDCPPFSAKTPLVLVDRFTDKESEDRYRDRYRFVNWERAKLFGDGFNHEALDAIFSE